MRKQIAAANWKMNLTFQQAEKLVEELVATKYELNENRRVVLGVPFPYLSAISAKVKNLKNMDIAAQNCSDKKLGAYTGETSVEMLKSIGVPYIIIGHSERREYFNESNETLATKVDIALEYGLQPIFCCGEPLVIREAGTQNSFVEAQLRESLFHLSAEQIRGFIIAYEPIWAIGTGKTASSDQAQEMHAHIRKVIAGKFADEIAKTVSILYGGSVKASNAAELFGKPDVDGGLVGGASLVATEFSVIIHALKK